MSPPIKITQNHFEQFHWTKLIISQPPMREHVLCHLENQATLQPRPNCYENNVLSRITCGRVHHNAAEGGQTSLYQVVQNIQRSLLAAVPQHP